MCGILYSQDSSGFTDLDILKRRGPDDFKDETNALGYFACSVLNITETGKEHLKKTKSGILLYNGSTKSNNDKNPPNEDLDESLNDTIDFVKSLDGSYALIYATERHVVFGVDHFENKNLWFYHDQDTRTLTIASVPNIVKQKHRTAWKAVENKIYTVDRQDFSIKIQTNRIFDLTQNTNNFDLVFEKFESAVKNSYYPEQSTSLLSSGMDCGVINCALHKIFGKVDCLADPQKEVVEVLKDRVKLHGARLLPNQQGHHVEKEKIFNDVLPNNEVWDVTMTNPVINLIKNGVRKRNKKIVVVGSGGDEIYNDRHGQMSGHSFAKTNGSFPSSLGLVWPWHNHNSQLRLMNIRFDLITGYFGVDANYPLTDVGLVQAWLNTTQKLKNEYKLWMKEYMLQEKYPFTTQKVHSFNPKYVPEKWKVVDDKYHLHS
jgi:asparagine synthetase B (glutamine-hydrolysing)